MHRKKRNLVLASALLVLLTWVPVASARQNVSKKAPERKVPDQSAFLQELDPQVSALFKSALAAYSQMKSYRHIDVWRCTSKGVENWNVTGTFALQRPNRFAYRPPECGSRHSMLVCDGKTLVFNLMQEYTKSPTPRTYPQADLDVYPLVLVRIRVLDPETSRKEQNRKVDMDDFLRGINDAPTNTLVMRMLQGTLLSKNDFAVFNAHPEWVWDRSLPDYRPGPTVVEQGKRCQSIVYVKSDENKTRTWTLFFDAATHLLIGSRGEFVTSDTRETITETFEHIEIDRPIDRTAFRFIPATGDRRVNVFSLYDLSE